MIDPLSYFNYSLQTNILGKSSKNSFMTFYSYAPNSIHYIKLLWEATARGKRFLRKRRCKSLYPTSPREGEARHPEDLATVKTEMVPRCSIPPLNLNRGRPLAASPPKWSTPPSSTSARTGCSPDKNISSRKRKREPKPSGSNCKGWRKAMK